MVFSIFGVEPDGHVEQPTPSEALISFDVQSLGFGLQFPRLSLIYVGPHSFSQASVFWLNS